MAGIKVEKKKGKSVVVMEGEMTIEHAASLRDSLLKSLEGADNIVLDLNNVTTVDLSFLQLLCSAHRTSVKAQKSMEMKSDYPESLKQAVREAGYSRHFGCTLESDSTCLWKGI